MKINLLLPTLLLAPIFILAQQFTGPNNSSSEINRTGRVGIGLSNSPNDTQLYVKT